MLVHIQIWGFRDFQTIAAVGLRVLEAHPLLQALKPSLELVNAAVIATTAELEEPGPRVAFANQGFTRLTGYPAAKAVGKALRMLGDLGQGREALSSLLEHFKRRQGAQGVADTGGEDSHAADGPWQIVPLVDEAGEVRHWLAFHRGALRENAAGRWQPTDAEIFRQLVEHQPDPICRFLPDTVLTYVNAAYAGLFRRKPDQLIGRRFIDFLTEEDGRAFLAHLASMSPAQPAGQYQFRTVRSDGRAHWCLWKTLGLFDEDGTIVSFQSVGADITESKQADEELRKLSNAVEHSPSTIVITDAEGLIEYVNPAFTITSGYSFDEAVGRKPSVVKSGLTPTEVYEDLWRTVKSGKIWRGEICNRKKDGSTFWDLTAIAPVKDSDGAITHFVSIQHDITQQKMLEKRMAYDASHDALTDLVNRREFERRLDHAVASARRQGTHHVLAFIDLDQFKLVNDTAGHAAGDELLKRIRSLLRAKFRGRDTLARLGGDEFALLFDNCSVARAEKICEMVISNLQELRFCWDGHSFHIGASIGLVPISVDTENATQAMSQADVACYAAKERGRNRVHVYRSEGAESSRRHSEILRAAAVRSAVEENRLCLYAQPIVPLSAERENGGHYELLVRMIDREGRLILPQAFIPAAERYGLIGDIDRWVIKTAFRHFEERFGGSDGVGISINLSGHSLNDNSFLEFIHKKFRRYSVPPERVCFEITETAAVHNIDHAKEFVAEIKKKGSRLALDDFGSGLSSFGYLKTLPVDFLKIDGRFVSDIIDNSIDHAMVAAINGIGRVMGIKTVAEYAHSRAIVDRLSDLGVNFAQGNAVGVPAPLDEVDPAHFPTLPVHLPPPPPGLRPASR